MKYETSGFFKFIGFDSFLSSFTSFKTLKNENTHPLINTIIYTGGKELTVHEGCTLCHHPEKKIVGPSFKTISKVYKGDANKLLNFLNGKSKPIVHPEEFSFMKPVLNQLKHLKLEDKKEIVKYILSL